jgi:hypothetical protein
VLQSGSLAEESVEQTKLKEPGLDLAAPEAFLSDFDSVVKAHMEIEASKFNEDTEYKACLTEVQAFALPILFLVEFWHQIEHLQALERKQQILNKLMVLLTLRFPCLHLSIVHTHHPPSLSQPPTSESRVNSC